MCVRPLLDSDWTQETGEGRIVNQQHGFPGEGLADAQNLACQAFTLLSGQPFDWRPGEPSAANGLMNRDSQPFRQRAGDLERG